MTHPPHHSRPPARKHHAAFLPDEAATAGIGERLSAHVAPGMRIYLRGELGSGKTSLVRGLLRGLGFAAPVKSPTYALVELYALSRLHLYHFDFYRFVDPREFEHAGFIDHFLGKAVCLVEWPERAGDALPTPDLELALSYSDGGRKIEAHAYSEAGERCLAGLSA